MGAHTPCMEAQNTCVINIFTVKRFPTDVNTYSIGEQLMLGGGLLISPVLEPNAVDVKAYVPDARWYDYYSGNHIRFIIFARFDKETPQTFLVHF